MQMKRGEGPRAPSTRGPHARCSPRHLPESRRSCLRGEARELVWWTAVTAGIGVAWSASRNGCANRPARVCLTARVSVWSTVRERRCRARGHRRAIEPAFAVLRWEAGRPAALRPASPHWWVLRRPVAGRAAGVDRRRHQSTPAVPQGAGEAPSLNVCRWCRRPRSPHPRAPLPHG